MLNNCIFIGRLTADPELRTTDNGVSVLSFSLAVQRNYKVDEKYPVDFPNFVAWRSTAEFISRNFKKGSMISLVTSYEPRKYIDKNEVERTAHEFKVEKAFFCGNSNQNNTTPSVADSVGGFTPVFPDTTDSFVDGDEDLPF